MIENGYHACILLDRYRDPNRPHGPDGPTALETLKMALDVFCVENDLDGIQWDQ
jgi:hypothetical protein